ncbi:polysialyltransferase family glycosyltransferase [Mariniflexile sp.]|uniref:polysialyltransferase family glycosyltransferase n=1 Tax=Mariniflexile sp. TaxID=1979402 RepID=UPI00356A2EFB
MRIKTLIITSGSSQLITQLSVLKKQHSDLSNVYLLYVGLFSESLEVFFRQISNNNGITYIGQIHFDINPILLSKKEFILYFITGKFTKLFKVVEKKFSLLRFYKKFDLLLIPVRVKVEVDNVLLCYLKPKTIVFVADGVIDKLPERNFTNWRYFYLRNTITKFPLSSNIYSPFFLEEDIKRIGIYKEVDINVILSDTRKIELSVRFEKAYLQNRISYVIISQHYHLHEGVKFENDISYFKQIIKYALNNCGNSKVLFKPHPRDIKHKIEIFENINDDRLLVVSDEFKSLPIELFGEEFKDMNTIFLTGNSSGPLFFNKSNRIISIGSDKYLHKELNNRIKKFANNYKVEYLNL